MISEYKYSGLFRPQDSSADALDQLSVGNEREREELLSKIEVEKKEAEQQVVHQYMSHYLLGLKVHMIGICSPVLPAIVGVAPGCTSGEYVCVGGGCCKFP